MTLNKKNISKISNDRRPIDRATDEISSWWGKSFVFVKKTEVKTWQGALLLMFVGGIAAALIWSARTDIFHDSSKAAGEGGSNLTFSAPVPSSLSIGDTFVINALVTPGSGENVDSADISVKYSNANLQLTSISKTTSVFGSELVNSITPNADTGIGVGRYAGGSLGGYVTAANSIVATFNFTVIGAGPASLTFNETAYTGTGGLIRASKVAGVVAGIPGTTVTGTLGNSNITINTGGGEICSSFTYGEWGDCQPNNTQTRSITSSSPAGCSGGSSVTSQSCTYVPPVITCTDFTYNGWGDCQANNTRYRSVASNLPTGCSGGSPILSEACTYIPPVATCTNFLYNEWSACSNGTMTRTVTSSSPSGCTGGSPITSQSCTQACTDFTYSDWTACSNSISTRTAVGVPSGCVGGVAPFISQSCTMPVAEKKEEHKDKKKYSKPKIVDLPALLNKYRGSKIWWKATDKYGIKYYKYVFRGRTFKTNQPQFIVPADTVKGSYKLKVRVYNKKGETTSKTITVNVR